MIIRQLTSVQMKFNDCVSLDFVVISAESMGLFVAVISNQAQKGKLNFDDVRNLILIENMGQFCTQCKEFDKSFGVLTIARQEKKATMKINQDPETSRNKVNIRTGG